jgi:formylglycine-generating enzyme required for sulfatase activity/energy-coupling factor transporter ATP-binding protein EcfA2
MPANEAASGIGIRQPYPGLRTFEPDEALKFYGRETHTAELLRRLSENRFIAVVGNSGSGKSSLVRAGLLPALYRGRLIGATSQWRICIMRPGDAPMKSLAQSLAALKVFSDDDDTVLREVGRSSLGMVRAVRASRFAPGESLLLVVDQFEELFRFVRARKEQDGGAETRLFVASLLEAADLSSAAVYVVLTMRSDFLGDCSRFPGLPEALNRSQYLIPRMTREQVRDAIEKPLRLVDARMSARLVELLLNELGDDTGRLPVLQHALNRTFHEFEKKGAGVNHEIAEIGVDDYAAAGELKGALNAHAEALLDSLRPPGLPGVPASITRFGHAISPSAIERWTERVFRCLTAVEGGLRVRRPTRLDRMFEIVGALDEESQKLVRQVVERYSLPDHAMLVWSGNRLTGDSVIDIVHESLIEHWHRLKRWVAAEADAASLYQDAAQDAVRKRRGAAAKWRGQKLAEAVGYIEKGPWNEAWAQRLPDSGARFSEVKEFVEGEAAAQTAEEEEKKAQVTKERDAERRAKEDAEARASAEGKAREAAEAAARAELRAREAAEMAAAAERKAREEAEVRAAAESRAKEAAESLVKAERRTKRWISAAALLGVAALGFGLAVQFNRTARAKAEKDLLELRNSEAVLRQQITASNDILKQYAGQIAILRDQVDRAKDPTEKRQLQAKLSDLINQDSQVRKQRDSAAAQLSADSRNRTRVNPADGLTYVFIPPGKFLMGCSPGDSECRADEMPHAEPIGNGFWLSQTEVTQAAWEKVRGGNPSYFKSDQLPVEQVDWAQASDYCRTIGGRLPTEKEWEYAARAGAASARYGSLDAVAWYTSNSGGTTHPVGLKLANAFGLYDMLGNVWEWTSDEYAGAKVVRGGSWYYNSRYVRASDRFRLVPSERVNVIGFRCVGEFR